MVDSTESPNLGRLDFCMLGKWIQRNCLGTQSFFSTKKSSTSVLNSWMVEAPELSYLFDFIDIDESGQVNLEELHLQMMMGNVLI